jgi:excisionase family DNA binding protein
MESMMSARQVAELLGVHENWVYDQAVGGDLPSYKIGGARRFEPGEVERWIAEHREVARERRARNRTVRRASVPAATQSEQALVTGPEREPESSQRTRRSRRAVGAATSGVVQPRLFES